MRFCYHTNPTTTPYDIQGNYPNMSGGVQYRERRGGYTDFPRNSNWAHYSFWEPLIIENAKGGGREVVTAYRIFHNMLNLRYEYAEYMTNSNGRKDSSQLCPVALTLQLFQYLLEIQFSQACDGFFRNTRILLYTPATVSLFLLKRFTTSSVLPSLYYLTFFIHICANSSFS